MCHSNVRLDPNTTNVVQPIVMPRAKRGKGVYRKIQFDDVIGDHTENKLDLMRELNLVEQMNSIRYGFDFIREAFIINSSCDHQAGCC